MQYNAIPILVYQLKTFFPSSTDEDVLKKQIIGIRGMYCMIDKLIGMPYCCHDKFNLEFKVCKLILTFLLAMLP